MQQVERPEVEVNKLSDLKTERIWKYNVSCLTSYFPMLLK